MRRALAVVAVFIVSGCLTSSDRLPASGSRLPEGVLQAIGTPIIQTHDHEDASLHVGSANMRLVAWDPLIPDEIGREGFAGLRVLGDHAYVATDGEHAGFLIVDLSDPTRPRLLSQYVTSGGASQEAVPTPDGKWLFLNLQRNPGPTELVADPERGTGYGIQVIDISDKENPRFESFFPVEIRGSHTVFYREIGGVPYVFLTAQPSRQGVPTGEVYTTPVGNEVVIARFSEVGGRHVLQRVSEYRYAGSLTATTSQGCFPHDMWVETHPKTRQEILYVAYWDCGAITVDVSDPLRPVELDVYADLAPSTVNRIHYFRPDPVLRDGRVIAYSGPEIDQSPGEPGYLRVYDVTDPADIRQIGHWRLPGEVENDMAFIFSPHNFEFHGDLLAFAHYHAGFWVLDISEPEAPAALGFYMPTGVEGAPFDRPVWKKEPNFPIAYLPNAYDARWYGDYIVGSERGTGLYIMEHTGPHP